MRKIDGSRVKEISVCKRACISIVLKAKSDLERIKKRKSRTKSCVFCYPDQPMELPPLNLILKTTKRGKKR